MCYFKMIKLLLFLTAPVQCTQRMELYKLERNYNASEGLRMLPIKWGVNNSIEYLPLGKFVTPIHPNIDPIFIMDDLHL